MSNVHELHKITRCEPKHNIHREKIFNKRLSLHDDELIMKFSLENTKKKHLQLEYFTESNPLY